MLIHRLLKSQLRHERIEVHNAVTGTEGVSMARALDPDVILLDVDMPDIDGFEVMRELKRHPVSHDIPVILLSTADDTDTKVRGLDMGAVDFITKPFDVPELKARVRSAVRMRGLIRMLAQRAQLDGMTGLWNRSYFDMRLAQEVANAGRYGHSLALILGDIDFFKNINDTHGHPFGDLVLERFARLLMGGRNGDIPCRYGGEEFGIILPDTTAEEAGHVANRIRRAFKGLRWDGCEDLSVTASFGVTDVTRAQKQNAESMVASADRALYAAKAAGRDRVVVDDRPERWAETA